MQRQNGSHLPNEDIFGISFAFTLALPSHLLRKAMQDIPYYCTVYVVNPPASIMPEPTLTDWGVTDNAYSFCHAPPPDNARSTVSAWPNDDWRNQASLES